MRQVFLPIGVIPLSTIMALLRVTQPFAVTWQLIFSSGMLFVKESSDDVKSMIFLEFLQMEKVNSQVSQNLNSDLILRKSIG